MPYFEVWPSTFPYSCFSPDGGSTASAPYYIYLYSYDLRSKDKRIIVIVICGELRHIKIRSLAWRSRESGGMLSRIIPKSIILTRYFRLTEVCKRVGLGYTTTFVPLSTPLAKERSPKEVSELRWKDSTSRMKIACLDIWVLPGKGVHSSFPRSS